MRRACFAFLIATLFACQDAEPRGSAESEGLRSRDASAQAKADASAGRKSGSGANADAKDAGAPSELPCEVKEILDAHCVSCHAADAPQFGAPMSLASVADFHAQAPRAGTVVYEAAADRIARTGGGVMPPSPQAPLPEEARAALLAWLEAEAPAGEGDCAESDDSSDAEPDEQTDDGDDGDDATGGDCEVSFELRAYGNTGGKFPIPQEDDHYECFYFKADVDADTLATSMSPLLDDTRVLHHWLLFAASNEDEAPSGTHRRCNGIHPGAYLMASWLPGTPALVLPDGVGMEMPSGPSAQFILENHYNNTSRYQGASDESGVKVCATNKPKAQHAAIHWLGSENITLLPSSSGSASATCTPATHEPIHILGLIPHMHRLGRHVNMTIQRANGTTEVMHDAPFEFENQAFYPKSLVLQPGDTVQTQCDYMNDTTGIVTLGEQTTDEMCYMFTLAYPIGSMNTGGDLLDLRTGQPVVQGPNRCMR